MGSESRHFDPAPHRPCRIGGNTMTTLVTTIPGAYPGDGVTATEAACEAFRALGWIPRSEAAVVAVHEALRKDGAA